MTRREDESFPLGTLVYCQNTFKTTKTDVVVDPTAVLFRFVSPNGVTDTTYTYGVDSQLVRDSAGVYYVLVDGNAEGRWSWKMYSTGTGQSSTGWQFFWINEDDI